ncbi:serine hydrolase domain-containing protein [Plantibacter elymi (nom. nud.)]|uniref:serine hydrolase domain-containing protein n=1 Tax=Plantibacter elymi (nom. nud.) TaxID=199708 RepID=UPI0013FD692E|nr:serine hydrolase domain-containing protein [Plantibacter sp. VKM Ac-1784]
MSAAQTVSGHVAPGFGRIADAFALNFRDRGDRGAACSIIIEGTTVVDIFGGEARSGVPWTAHTRSAVFSVSKGVTAISLVMAADQGLLDLDQPVATYWPEFAAHGKDRITIRAALAHRCGVPSFSQPWDAAALSDWYPVVADLAAQQPLWEPGAAFLYHPVSVGFIAGEVLRRATGKRPSEWLAEYVTGPYGLQMSYGAPVSDPDLALQLEPEGIGGGIPLSAEDAALAARMVLMDGAYAPDLFTAANLPGFLGPESPAANIVTGAADLAALYGATVYATDGPRLLSDDAIAHAIEPISYGKPLIGADRGDVWGTGFMLHSARRSMAGPGSFGHDGAGGQLAFAQPSLGLGFGYQTIQPGGDDDIRAEALCVALRESL